MKCEFCNMEIVSGSEVEENGHYFCNSLHRYNWRNTDIDNLNTQPNKKAVKPSKVKLSPEKIIIIIFVVLGSSLGPTLFHYADNLLGEKNKVDPAIMASVNTMNKSLPVMIDAETRLDNVLALPGQQFLYNYTLVNYSRNSFDTTLAQTQLRPRMINLYKTSPDLKLFRDYGFKVICTYRYKDGGYAMRITINPEEYK